MKQSELFHALESNFIERRISTMICRDAVFLILGRGLEILLANRIPILQSHEKRYTTIDQAY
ncbi:hypothetical protein DVB69_14640 [Sporosarcina sp. BI001-red]|nr:hypothetical protein DVB69_14640 [Sporosarcina sp. BI001-red]